MLSRRFAVSVLALALAAGCASAGVIATYTDPTTFNNNTANLFAINLGSLTSSSTGLTDPTSGILFSDINGGNALSVTNCGSVCQLQTNDIAFINGINIKTPSNI